MRNHRRTSGKALIAAAALALAGCGANTVTATPTAGNPTTSGAPVFQGNFSDPAQQWPTPSDATKSVTASGDTYTVQLNSAGTFDASPTIATVQPQDLANVSVSVLASPTSDRSGDRFGVFCRSIQNHSYAFLVGPASSSGQLTWSILLRQPSGVRQLASGTTATPSTSPFTIRGDCVQGGVEHLPVVLALYLGGKLVGQAQDAKLPAPFIGRPGVSVSSAHGGTGVNFSSFQVSGASAS